MWQQPYCNKDNISISVPDVTFKDYPPHQIALDLPMYVHGKLIPAPMHSLHYLDGSRIDSLIMINWEKLDGGYIIEVTEQEVRAKIEEAKRFYQALH